MADINPNDWRVLGSFTHDGVTYGPGAPPPVMPLNVAEGLERAALIARPRADGSIPPPPVPVPQAPADYLRNSDVMLLRALKEFPPTPGDLAEITRLAAVAGRSDVIRAALELAQPAAHGSSPRQPESVQLAIARVRSELQADLKLATDENAALGNELESMKTQKTAVEDELRRVTTENSELKAAVDQLKQHAQQTQKTT